MQSTRGLHLERHIRSCQRPSKLPRRMCSCLAPCTAAHSAVVALCDCCPSPVHWCIFYSCDSMPPSTVGLLLRSNLFQHLAAISSYRRSFGQRVGTVAHLPLSTVCMLSLSLALLLPLFCAHASCPCQLGKQVLQLPARLVLFNGDFPGNGSPALERSV